VDTIYWRRK